MSNRRRPTQPGRARIIGTPGNSTRAHYRQAIFAYRNLPIRWLLVGFVLALGVIGSAAHSIGGPALRAMGIAAAVAVALDLSARFTSIAATVVVVAISSVLATPFAVIYAFAATQSEVDEQAAVLTMIATLSLAGLLAHRTSKGRPWLTTLLVAVGVMFVGPFLLLINPWLGFGWTWFIMATVLFLRGGGTAWCVDKAEGTYEFLRRRRNRSKTLPRMLDDIETKHEAQMLTADLLADLNEQFVVFHDRQLSSGQSIDHIVVGPSGIYVVESAKFKGRIREDATQGLIHDRVIISELLNDTDALAAFLNRSLRFKGSRTHPVVVVHDAVLPTRRARVALSRNGDALGTVVISSPAALVETFTDAPILMSPRQVRRTVARIHRVTSPANAESLPSNGVSAFNVETVVVDDDGHPKTPQSSADPLFDSSNSETILVPGQSVTLLTNEGTFTDWEVTGEPTLNDNGTLYVPVSPKTVDTTEPAPVTWFPLDSVQPAGPL